MLLLFEKRRLFAVVAARPDSGVDMGVILAATIGATEADRVVLLVDAYLMDFQGGRADYEQIAERFDAGEVDIAAMFATGDPSVTEALYAVDYRREGYQGTSVAPYRIDAGRAVRWLDWPNYEDDHGDNSGELHFGLSAAVPVGFLLQSGRVAECKPAHNWHRLRKMLPRDAVHVLPPVTVPRLEPSGPCPCGSGRRVEHCCWG